MRDITTLLNCIKQCLDPTLVGQLVTIVTAMLGMSGRVTMLGISRWTEKGGSYRTVQRFYRSAIPWLTVTWTFFCTHLLNPGDTYIMGGDESVITKAGKRSYGLDRFFSSLYDKPVPGLAFFAFSLINVRTRTASPLFVEQVVRSAEEKAATKQKQTAAKAKKQSKAKVGRPPGSKNHDKTVIAWTPLLRLLAQMLLKVIPLFKGWLTVKYLVMDGQFGNNNTLQMVRQGSSFHLISKLRTDSALYFRHDGPQNAVGARRKYGDKINYDQMPERYRQQTTTTADIQTQIYQAVMLHDSFAQPLNVVILLKTNLKTHAKAHVILFSSDLELAFDTLIDYYSLRFQIEFNFRDAKQFWGFEDFMNINQTAITNAVNLAFFMVNLTQPLLADFRQTHPLAGILDLKLFFRSRRYLALLLKLLPQTPDPIFIDHLFHQFAALGSIHPKPQAT